MFKEALLYDSKGTTTLSFKSSRLTHSIHKCPRLRPTHTGIGFSNKRYTLYCFKVVNPELKRDESLSQLTGALLMRTEAMLLQRPKSSSPH